MNDFVIITDATCDLPEDVVMENQLVVIPMGYTMDGEEYKGTPDNKLNAKDFYNKVRAGSLPKTAQITPDEYSRCFEGYLQQGKDVLYLAFSSALSGSCSNAFLCMQELQEKYPENKIYVVDSRGASLGEGLLVWYAAQMKKDGANIEEIKQWAEENRDHLCHYFTVDDLNHLHRGGRVSKAAAVFGTMLGVKPVLHVDNEGRLIPVAKVRGRKQSLHALVDKMEQLQGSYKNEIVFVSHGDCIQDAQYTADLVKQRFGIQRFIINDIGPVIGSHSGPGTVALFFLGEQK